MTDFVLDTFLPYQLAVAAERVSREFSRSYTERFGISIAEWRVVAHLSQSGTVSVREIHARVGMDKSKVSRAASRLEQAGYVEKRENPGDRRLVDLSLTPSGWRLIGDLAPLARAFEDRVMRDLGTDAPAFRAALARLISSGLAP